jgi:single-strand DNA-binding protein
MSVCNFILAVERQLSRDKKSEYQEKGIPTADFPKIITWGKTADMASRYLTKGQRIAIEGSLQTGSYEKNGIKIFTCDVVATRIEYLERAEKQPSLPPETRKEARQEVPMPNSGDFMDLLDDDEVPF